MTAAAEFLAGEETGPGEWTFATDRRLHGAFGGVFGGGVAAATLVVARSLAGGRRAFSLHCTFARTLSDPAQEARARVTSEGRTVTTVAVELTDGDDRLVATSTATFADEAALYEFDADGPLRSPELKAFDEGWELPVPEGVEAPIMDLLELRLTGFPDGGFAHAIRAPWTKPDDVAEGATMIADYCAGVPVGAAVGPEGTRIPVPNPDLSVRFVGNEWDDLLVGVGRLGRIDRGVAATQVEVWTGPAGPWSEESPGKLIAIGLSSAVMLGRGQG